MHRREDETERMREGEGEGDRVGEREEGLRTHTRMHDADRH